MVPLTQRAILVLLVSETTNSNTLSRFRFGMLRRGRCVHCLERPHSQQHPSVCHTTHSLKSLSIQKIQHWLTVGQYSYKGLTLTCGSPDKISVQIGLAIWKAFGLISMEERLSTWKGATRARGSFTTGGKGHSGPWTDLYNNSRQQSLSLHIERCLLEYSNKHTQFNHLWSVLTYNGISLAVNYRSSSLCHLPQAYMRVCVLSNFLMCHSYFPLE